MNLLIKYYDYESIGGGEDGLGKEVLYSKPPYTEEIQRQYEKSLRFCKIHTGFNADTCEMCELEKSNPEYIKLWNITEDNRIIIKDYLNAITNAISIMSAYRQDDTWSEWDESVYNKILLMQKFIYLASIKTNENGK